MLLLVVAAAAAAAVVVQGVDGQAEEGGVEPPDKLFIVAAVAA
jgi:hypothetical protein